MLEIVIKPYVRHKLNDILAAEIKSMTDESYESPYFQDELWRKAAWDIHRQVKYAYDKAVQKIYKIIDDIDLTEEEHKKVYQMFTIEPYCDEKGNLCINVKIMEE